MMSAHDRTVTQVAAVILALVPRVSTDVRSAPDPGPGLGVRATPRPGAAGAQYRTSLCSSGGYTVDGSPSTVVPANCSIARVAPFRDAG